MFVLGVEMDLYDVGRNLDGMKMVVVFCVYVFVCIGVWMVWVCGSVGYVLGLVCVGVEDVLDLCLNVDVWRSRCNCVSGWR